jgi:hypothetical protein
MIEQAQQAIQLQSLADAREELRLTTSVAQEKKLSFAPTASRSTLRQNYRQPLFYQRRGAT